jgi:hypothetical protein
MMSVQCHYKECRVVDMRTVDGTQVLVNTSSVAGGESGDVLPVSAALVLTLRTEKRGRSYRGRLYLAGFGEDHWEGANYDGALTGALLTDFAAFETAVNAAGWTWVVASYYNNGSARSAAIGTTVSNYVFRSAQAGTQRRRLDRP